MFTKLSQNILRLCGWKVNTSAEKIEGCIVLGAPHTTNWDLPVTLLGISALGLRCHWAMKSSLFFFPLGPIFKKLGGLPVNRKVRNDFPRLAASHFAADPSFNLAIAPEGTRSYTDHWKCGFYQIALDSGANIALGYADYEKKEIGIGPVITPSGDIEKDFEIFKNFYRDKKGRHPEKQSLVAIRPKELKLFQKKQGKNITASE